MHVLKKMEMDQEIDPSVRKYNQSEKIFIGRYFFIYDMLWHVPTKHFGIFGI